MAAVTATATVTVTVRSLTVRRVDTAYHASLPQERQRLGCARARWSDAEPQGKDAGVPSAVRGIRRVDE